MLPLPAALDAYSARNEVGDVHWVYEGGFRNGQIAFLLLQKYVHQAANGEGQSTSPSPSASSSVVASVNGLAAGAL